MKIALTGDYYEDAGLESIIDELLENLEKYFKKKTYSSKEPEIFIVINCSPKNLKLRRRYSKKENVLYYDIILDYTFIKNHNKNEKKVIVANAVIDSLDWLNKYDFEINVNDIKKDTKKFF